MNLQIHQEALARVVSIFDRPLIQNNFRGTYVEALVDLALGEAWRQQEDWAGWDFEHEDGTRLEVKQSALHQSWQKQDSDQKPRSGVFSIRSAQGYYVGSQWIDEPGRPANIYLFAWHGSSGAVCDHRDVGQWEFYLTRAERLPVDQKTLGIGAVRSFSNPVRYDSLFGELEQLRCSPAEIVE